MSRAITLTGFSFIDASGGPTTPVAATLEIRGTDNLRVQFIYDPVASNPAEGDIVGDFDVTQGTLFDTILNDTVSLTDNEDYDVSIERVNFSGSVGDYLIVGTDVAQGYQLHVFRLTATNPFSSEVPTRAELQAALQNVSTGPVTDGTFAGAFNPATVPGAVSAPFDPFTGTAEDDTIIGGPGNDLINGLDGNDRLEGRDGNDTLIGGAGSDTLFGGAGNDLLIPGTNTGDGDLIYSGPGNDTIRFEEDAGNSFFALAYYPGTTGIRVSLDGPQNTASVIKGDGLDVIENVAGAILADGLDIGGTLSVDEYYLTGMTGGYLSLRPLGGNDLISLVVNGQVRIELRGGTTGVDVNIAEGRIYDDGFGSTDTVQVLGGDGVLELRGTNFNDRLIGSDANEWFITERGNDTVDGGGGIDRVRYDRDGVAAINVDLAANTASGTWGDQSFSDTLYNIEQIRGSRTGNDLILGDDTDNWLWGLGGNDTLAGRGGTNFLFGGPGTDTVILDGALADAVVDYHDEGVRITFGDSDNFISEVELFQFDDATLTLAQIEALLPSGETIIGTDGDDSIVGTGGDDVIAGGAGADTLSGGGGDDVISGSTEDDLIYGGSGNDNIGGGTGNDTIYGGPGDDTIGGGQGDDVIYGDSGDDALSGGVGNDEVYGGDGNDTIGGSLGNDTIRGDAGDDSLGGGTGRDLLYGGTGNDSIGGGEGDDTIYGGAGQDFLAGGGRNDLIFGGDGNDTINSGAGNDEMFGGSGADLFIFNSFTDGERDVIGDFEVGVDRIRLSGVEGQGLQGRFNALDLTNITVNGAPAVEIEYDGHVIVLQGVRANDLSLSDFLFIG